MLKTTTATNDNIQNKVKLQHLFLPWDLISTRVFLFFFSSSVTGIFNRHCYSCNFKITQTTLQRDDIGGAAIPNLSVKLSHAAGKGKERRSLTLRQCFQGLVRELVFLYNIIIKVNSHVYTFGTLWAVSSWHGDNINMSNICFSILVKAAAGLCEGFIASLASRSAHAASQLATLRVQGSGNVAWPSQAPWRGLRAEP